MIIMSLVPLDLKCTQVVHGHHLNQKSDNALAVEWKVITQAILTRTVFRMSIVDYFRRQFKRYRKYQAPP